MNTRRLLVLLLVFFLILVVDLLWVPFVPWLRLSMNLTLVTVIGMTIGERLIIGLAAAFVAGLVISLFSAVSGPGYILAFLAAASGSWLFGHKIVTSRSAVSFVSTIMVGTMTYSLALLMMDWLLTLINHQRLHLDATVIVMAGLIQLIIHPVLLSLVWRLFGRHQYHRLPTSVAQSF